MNLQLNDFVSGISSIICVLISLMIGLTIASKYLKYKQKTLLYIGYTVIGLFTPWWASSISFIIALFDGGVGLFNLPSIYFFIVGFLTASIAIAEITAIVDLLELDEKSKKGIIIFIAIESIIIELIYIVLCFVQTEMIGILTGPLDVTFENFGKFWAANFIIIFLLTFISFSIKSMKSQSPEIKLKGKLILLGSLSFTIAAILDSLITLDIWTLMIVRTILILSSFLLYFGFLLPNSVKNIFIK